MRLVELALCGLLLLLVFKNRCWPCLGVSMGWMAEPDELMSVEPVGCWLSLLFAWFVLARAFELACLCTLDSAAVPPVPTTAFVVANRLSAPTVVGNTGCWSWLDAVAFELLFVGFTAAEVVFVVPVLFPLLAFKKTQIYYSILQGMLKNIPIISTSHGWFKNVNIVKPCKRNPGLINHQ